MATDVTPKRVLTDRLSLDSGLVTDVLSACMMITNPLTPPHVRAAAAKGLQDEALELLHKYDCGSLTASLQNAVSATRAAASGERNVTSSDTMVILAFAEDVRSVSMRAISGGLVDL